MPCPICGTDEASQAEPTRTPPGRTAGAEAAFHQAAAEPTGLQAAAVILLVCIVVTWVG